jgi:trehalose 6-phosphate phosphatase
VLAGIRERADAAGILLDFDGSLSPIVSHPDLASAADGVHDVLARLARRYRLVAVISGRTADDLVPRLGAIEGLTLVGLYGMQDAAPELELAVLPLVEQAASAVPEAWVEDKQLSIAVHYRGAADPGSARRALVAELDPVASEAGLDLVEGKMVVELVPRDRPMKGGAVERLVGEHGLEAALFAGDDVADLDAFAALERLASSGLLAVKVAVRGAETPAELVARSDLAVDGPDGLVELLGRLV